MRNMTFLATLVATLAVPAATIHADESTQQANNANIEIVETQLEEILVQGTPSTFGASKSQLPIAEMPRTISIITEDEFFDRGALSLSNTLDYTAGVTGAAFGFATRGDFTSIRGLDAPEYQDNLQVLFGFYNNARADIYTLEQVEVLKGPASVLYGQAAPGGILSTVSKVAGADNLGNEVVLSVGSDDRLQAAFDSGFNLSNDGKWSARLVGLVRESDTQVDFVNDDAVVFAPSVTFENEKTKITALVNFTDRDSDTSAQFLPLAGTACGSSSVSISEPNVCAFASGQEVDHSLYVGDPNFNKYDTEATTISLFATHELNEFLTFEGTVRHRDNDAEYNQTWISFLGDGNPRIFPDGTAFGRSWSSSIAGSEQFAFDVRLRGIFETGNINHEVLAGINYQDVDTNANDAFFYALPTTFNVFNPVYDGSEVPPSELFDANRYLLKENTKATDVYITDHMNIGNLVVSAGIRFSSVESEDNFNSQKDDETPISLGLLYKTDFGLNPYISYAESFRATIGTDIETGTVLKPRKGKQTEIGFKYQPNVNGFFTVSYFDIKEDNLVEFTAGGATQPGLSIDTKGFEIEAKFNWHDFIFDFDYRHLDAKNVDGNGTKTTRPSLPDNAASLWASWEPSIGSLVGLRIGTGIRYAGKSESNGTAYLAANGFAPTPNRVVTDGQTLLDALIGYQFEKFDVSLNVRNLANKEFYSTCLSRGDCFVGEQRTVVGTVKMTF